MSKKIKLGVVGLGRGMGFAHGAGDLVGMELVALCDTFEEPLVKAGKDLGVATYTDYDKFLEHDLDAVVLANFFHQHAPFAIKALQAGKHVMSETMACFTMAEGVALVEAVEKSGCTYMFAENYPYAAYNQEMRRLYQSGLIGEFQYGEGEYVHPGDANFWNSLSPGPHHWRNWLAATYYSSHSLAPIMFITDTMPVKVNGFVVPADLKDEERRMKTTAVGDNASAIMVRMDNGGIAKLLQVFLKGGGIWVRIHGNKGLMENLRTGSRGMLRIVREPWETGPDESTECIYSPNFPEHHAEAARTGHGGGDFFMNYHFAQAIRSGQPPYLDVYRGVAMAAVAILAYRSALNDSNTEAIPDFRDPAARAKFATDDWNPDPATHREGIDPWPSIRGKIEPTPEGLAYAREVWRRNGQQEAP